MKRKKRFSFVKLWLILILFLSLSVVVLYSFLHKQHPAFRFWLQKDRLLIEVVIWSLFGALTSMLISAITLVRAKIDLPLRYFLLQLLQILSAPILAVILFSVLYHWGASDTFDKSFILLSFIAGLLPGYLLAAITKASPEQQFAMATFHTEQVSDVNAEAEKQTYEFQEDLSYGLLTTVTVRIKLELDDAGLFFDEKKEVIKKGFDHASVSLQSVHGGEIITAERILTGHQHLYLSEQVEPGTYLIRAMQSIRMSDNTLLNLFGEQEIPVSGDEINTVIYLRKLEI